MTGSGDPSVPVGRSDPLTPGTAAADVVAALAERRQTVATAESLTAGLVSAAIAGVAGASTVLRGGLVVYATDLKATLAGVPQEVLDGGGPVTPETAQALAAGARLRCGATWGIGLTGVAGPTEQDGSPVGTVYMGVAGPDGSEVRQWTLQGGRWEIRYGAAVRALAELLDAVRGGST